nr:ferric reductase-like transmembrane domain-containing protein [Azotobacter salinestris]
MNLTGILAVGAMSLGLFLAIRPAFLESFVGGLDKGYRLHKWLGISALVLSVVHWLWVKVPKWMVGWGWLERPAARRRERCWAFCAASAIWPSNSASGPSTPPSR